MSAQCALASRVSCVCKEWTEAVRCCQNTGDSFEHAIGPCVCGRVSAWRPCCCASCRNCPDATGCPCGICSADTVWRLSCRRIRHSALQSTRFVAQGNFTGAGRAPAAAVGSRLHKPWRDLHNPSVNVRQHGRDGFCRPKPGHPCLCPEPQHCSQVLAGAFGQRWLASSTPRASGAVKTCCSQPLQLV